MKSQPPAWLFSFESTNLAEKKEEQEEEKKHTDNCKALRISPKHNII